MTANTNLFRLQQLLPQLFQPIAVAGDLYLRFQLTPEIPALLSMKRVQEALLVSASAISSLPNMPAFTIGVMNARNRVFCVVDLSQLLGLSPLPANPRNYQIVVINLLGEKYLGLAVHRVKGVARFETEKLQSSVEGFPDFLEPYAIGCFVNADERVLLLDAKAIAISPLLSVNPAAKLTR